MTHPPIGQQRQPETKEAAPDIWKPAGPPHIVVNQRGRWRTDGYTPPVAPVANPEAP